MLNTFDAVTRVTLGIPGDAVPHLQRSTPTAPHGSRLNMLCSIAAQVESVGWRIAMTLLLLVVLLVGCAAQLNQVDLAELTEQTDFVEGRFGSELPRDLRVLQGTPSEAEAFVETAAVQDESSPPFLTYLPEIRRLLGLPASPETRTVLEAGAFYSESANAVVLIGDQPPASHVLVHELTHAMFGSSWPAAESLDADLGEWVLSEGLAQLAAFDWEELTDTPGTKDDVISDADVQDVDAVNPEPQGMTMEELGYSVGFVRSAWGRDQAEDPAEDFVTEVQSTAPFVDFRLPLDFVPSVPPPLFSRPASELVRTIVGPFLWIESLSGLADPDLAPLTSWRSDETVVFEGDGGQLCLAAEILLSSPADASVVSELLHDRYPDAEVLLVGPEVGLRRCGILAPRPPVEGNLDRLNSFIISSAKLAQARFPSVDDEIALDVARCAAEQLQYDSRYREIGNLFDPRTIPIIEACRLDS